MQLLERLQQCAGFLDDPWRRTSLEAPNRTCFRGNRIRGQSLLVLALRSVRERQTCREVLFGFGFLFADNHILFAKVFSLADLGPGDLFDKLLRILILSDSFAAP